MYKLNYVAITHPGNVRDNNEDNFYIDGKWKQDENQKTYKTLGSVKNGKLMAAVCDGMGGCAKGERASRIAVETVAEYDSHIKKEKASHLWIKPNYCIELINMRICDEMKKHNSEMGTTLSLLEFYEDCVVAENLGDSRIYRYRDGKLEQLSKDHTVVERMFQLGQITEEEKETHPMRHRITQYLGIRPEEMIVEPTVIPLKAIKVSERYLLCSDGLTDMVKRHEIADIMGQENTLEATAELLVNTALKAGGRDNITVVIVEVERGKGIWNIR